MSTPYYAVSATGGPKTPQGRAIAARNATSHGLFARDVVLTHLGEDPAAYNTLYLELCGQLDPQNLIERHYTEEIAAASWRLRRLHRWQAQVYEDPRLTEDERLDKLDKVLRHETALHHQINRSVRLLGRDVPQLFEGRARKRALAELDQTERACRLDPDVEAEVAHLTREHLLCEPLPPDFDRATLDNTRPVPETPADTQNCQNEPPAHTFDREQYERDLREDREHREAPPLPVDHVHPDGRPAYVPPGQWRYMARMRAEDKGHVADNLDNYWRREHLARLAKVPAPSTSLNPLLCPNNRDAEGEGEVSRRAG